MSEHIEWVAGGSSLTFDHTPSGQYSMELNHIDLSLLSPLSSLLSPSLVPMNTHLSSHNSPPFSSSLTQHFNYTVRKRRSQTQVANLGGKSRSQIQVENPGRKSRWKIQVENPGGKSRSQIQVANPGRKSRWKIQVANPGRKSGSQIQLSLFIRFSCDFCEIQVARSRESALSPRLVRV